MLTIGSDTVLQTNSHYSDIQNQRHPKEYRIIERKVDLIQNSLKLCLLHTISRLEVAGLCIGVSIPL
jgi:hypothetical protein